jgi:hypothetical protein
MPPAMLRPSTILEVDSVEEAEGVLVAVAEATGKENGRIEKDWLGIGDADGDGIAEGDGDGDGGGTKDGDGAIGEGSGDGRLFVGCTMIGLGSDGGRRGGPTADPVK